MRREGSCHPLHLPVYQNQMVRAYEMRENGDGDWRLEIGDERVNVDVIQRVGWDMQQIQPTLTVKSVQTRIIGIFLL